MKQNEIGNYLVAYEIEQEYVQTEEKIALILE